MGKTPAGVFSREADEGAARRIPAGGEVRLPRVSSRPRNPRATRQGGGAGTRWPWCGRARRGPGRSGSRGPRSCGNASSVASFVP